MVLALRRLKVYLKLIAIGAVVVIVLLVVAMNRGHTTEIWFFGPYEKVPVLWLIVVTALSSVAGWWVVSRMFGVLRELREVRQARLVEKQRLEQQRLAQELKDREREIDEKIRRSIREET